MSRSIGTIVETLMRRVRQAGGLAIDPDLATEIYSYCEQITNARTKRVTSTTTLSVPKQRLLFNFRDEISDAIEIHDIRESNRRIEKLDDIKMFAAYETTWFRNITGTRFEAWCQIGRDLLILYPGQSAASSADIEYVQLLTLHTNFATAYNTNSQLPDEDVELALKLAEITLLCRFRQLVAFKTRIEDFAAKYGASKP